MEYYPWNGSLGSPDGLRVELVSPTDRYTYSL